MGDIIHNDDRAVSTISLWTSLLFVIVESMSVPVQVCHQQSDMSEGSTI